MVVDYLPWEDLDAAGYERRVSAYHEAGHALCGLLFGWTLGRLAIESDGRGGAGTCVFINLSSDPVIHVAVDLAALAATAVAAGQGALEDDDLLGCLEDRARALRRLAVATGIAGPLADEYLGRFEGACERLLRRHWLPLEALARALEGRGTLDHAGAVGVVVARDPTLVRRDHVRARAAFAARVGVPRDRAGGIVVRETLGTGPTAASGKGDVIVGGRVQAPPQGSR